MLGKEAVGPDVEVNVEHAILLLSEVWLPVGNTDGLQYSSAFPIPFSFTLSMV